MTDSIETKCAGRCDVTLEEILKTFALASGPVSWNTGDISVLVAALASEKLRADGAEAERDEATRKLDLSLRAWEARNSVELVGDEAYAWADLMESDDAARLLAETRRERDAAVAARAESEAALSLLREQWDAMVRERDEARAVERYGHEAQMRMLQEECAELIVAASHYLRDRDDVTEDDIASELADVEIMLEQMRAVFGDNLVDEAKRAKLERLAKVLGGVR